MSLTIAVQMDPIERINIRGNSTFALLLEAQKRGHGIAYYTPDRLALRDARVFATVQPLKVRDQPGDHFTLGEPARAELATFDVVLLRQDPAVRSRLHHQHAYARARPSQDACRQRSGAGAQRAGKDLRDGISRADAADADHPRPRRDQGVPRRARRHRDEAALRQGRRGGVPAGEGKTSISARCSISSPSPSASSGWCRNSCRR